MTYTPDSNLGRFYVAVLHDNQWRWINTEGNKILSHPWPEYAEAMTMEKTHRILSYFHSQSHSTYAYIIECNSRALIPAEMREKFNA